MGSESSSSTSMARQIAHEHFDYVDLCIYPASEIANDVADLMLNFSVTQNAALLEALARIRDGVDVCECDHSTEDCCALCDPVDYVCPFCIADIALVKAKEITDGK